MDSQQLSILLQQAAPYLGVIFGTLFATLIPFLLFSEADEKFDWRHARGKLSAMLVVLVFLYLESPEIGALDTRAAIELGLFTVIGGGSASAGRALQKFGEQRKERKEAE